MPQRPTICSGWMLGVPSATDGPGCGGGGSSLPQLGIDSEGIDPEQPASVNAEISAAAERRSMEQAMDTPLRSSSHQTHVPSPGPGGEYLRGGAWSVRRCNALLAGIMRQMHLVRGGGKAALAASLALGA